MGEIARQRAFICLIAAIIQQVMSSLSFVASLAHYRVPSIQSTLTSLKSFVFELVGSDANLIFHQ